MNAAQGPGQPDHPHVISPGQWTEDIRGPGVGADWNHTDWRSYGRLETLCGAPIARLMRADDDAQAMRLRPGGPGWAGLMRALLLTLRPEQDERAAEPEHLPWRLRWMKEQWGALRVRCTTMTACRTLAVMSIEEMSTRLRAVCGAPGGLRGKFFR